MDGSEASDERYLEWLRSKHDYQGAEFVNTLVNRCAKEFEENSHLTEEQRAEIYKRVRQTVEAAYDSCLRKHARVSCCS